MNEVVLRGIWMELEALFHERPRFTGQILLHCEGGVVRKYSVTEVRNAQIGALVVQDARVAEAGKSEPR